MAEKKYLHSIDLIKGSLILLVITGHILQGKAEDNFARYVIYGFHMPLFVAVSGFLVNYERLKSTTAIQLLKNYLYRAIIPWCLATIGYYFITNVPGTYHLKGLLLSFVLPFYHLWYIPAFLFYVFITWLFSKLNVPFVLVLLFALVLSIVGYVIFVNPQLAASHHLSKVGNLFKIIRPQFYLFFCLGVSCKIYPGMLQWHKGILTTLLIIFAGLYLYCGFHFNTLASTVGFFMLNLSLAILLFQVASANSLPRSKFLQWIGVNSLPIYLWHVVPIYLLEQAVYNKNPTLFYLLSIAGVGVIMLLVFLLSKVSYINKYVFGSRG